MALQANLISQWNFKDTNKDKDHKSANYYNKNLFFQPICLVKLLNNLMFA